MQKFVNNSDDVKIWESQNQIVLKVEQNNLIKQEYRFTNSAPYEDDASETMMFYKRNYNIITKLLFTDRYFFLKGYGDGRGIFGLYDLGSDSCQKLQIFVDHRLGGFIDDLDGGVPFFPQFVINDFAIADVLNWDNVGMISKEDIKSESFLRIKENYDFNDNPVIRIVYLKELGKSNEY